jgi:hypothetical protein
MVFQSITNELIIHIGILVDSPATIAGSDCCTSWSYRRDKANYKYSVDFARFVFDKLLNYRYNSGCSKPG